MIGFRQLEGMSAASTAMRMKVEEKEVNALYLDAVRLWKDLAREGE